MRKIEFSELKLKNITDEEAFYQAYLKKLPENDNNYNNLNVPIKQYENTPDAHLSYLPVLLK